MTAKLVVLHVSPWSERARWALDHHGLAYELVQHAPFLGERRLRRLVGPNAGPVTVPVWFDGERVISQSWEIVAHADRTGNGTLLLPSAHLTEIHDWVAEIDAAMSHGRALVIRGMLASPGALDESVPPPAPKWLRPLMRPFTRYGTKWFARKYGLDLEAVAEHERAMRVALETLRARIGTGRYLYNTFTYADIVGATLLQGIAPVDDAYILLEPATRAVWTHDALAHEFADLVRWRDDLYRDHRNAAATARPLRTGS